MANGHSTDALAVPSSVEVVTAPLWVRFTGLPAELVAADLILPEWLPPFPKRTASSYDVAGGWWLSPADYQAVDYRERPKGDRSHPLEGWALKRRKGGVFELVLWARYTRIFGGPGNAKELELAIGWHRATVCARADRAFRRFMVATLAGSNCE